MVTGWRPQAGWTLAALSAAVTAAATATGLATRQLPFDAENVYPNVVYGVLFPVVGALIVTRAPRHPLGWLFCLSGVASGVTLAAYAYAQQGLVTSPGSLPGALAAGWVSNWVWVCGLTPLVTFGVLLFPDGRLPSRRWRPAAALAGGAVALPVFSTAFAPGPLINHPVRDNPLGLPVPRDLMERLGTVGFVVFLVAFLAAVGALAVRWRRADRDGRRPLNWFLLAASALAVALAAGEAVGDHLAGAVLAAVAIPMLPLAAGVAVLRHDLYGRGPAVRRSLVYAALLAGGLTVYAGTVLALDLLLRGRAAPGVTLAAGAAVALAFQPLRLRVEGSVDRFLYGERRDPYVVLSRLGERVEQASGAAGLLAEMAQTVATALRLPYVAVAVPGLEPAAYGEARGPLHDVPLVSQGEQVGSLRVGHRDEHETFTAGELRLLDDLGRQVGVATRSVLLARDLQRSRERLVTAREEERRRIRRDLHDGLGPALAGVAFGLDAARNLLADDPASADEQLRQLKEETQTCIADIRRLVYDLRPPALDELGLLPALAEYADRLSSRDSGLAVTVEAAQPLPALPAAVEAAAYRIAVEALTNVSRHAQARHCLLRLGVDDGDRPELRLLVRDDGRGLPAPRRPGVGLASMGERATELGGSCRVVPRPEGGTDVLARLPLAVS